MTQRKHFKQFVRARMAKTGESYVTARRQVLGQVGPTTIPWHFPGSVPGATAFRVIATAAGHRSPRTGQPLSEAMTYGLAGGIGIGVFSFFYEKEDVATFFLAGRHLWHDHQAYLSNALTRLGLAPQIRESGTAKAAAAALREVLSDGRPCVAWVDMALLPHRSLPESWAGGAYHVVTVYRIDDGTTLIGDLTDEPVPIPEGVLTAARGRIKKDRYRLLTVGPSGGPVDLVASIRDGLRACQRGLTGEGGVKSAKANFSLTALERWADRLGDAGGKDSWERVFAPGKRLWSGLVSILRCVEYWGTGGGLGRPLFAEFLTEAADVLKDARLRALAGRYADLGRQWSELAQAALPKDVPAFHEACEEYARIAELTNSGGDPGEIRTAWERLDALERQASTSFPLSEQDAAALRGHLHRRVRSLAQGEVAAHADLQRLLS
jgi:hypothetical protein